MISRRDSAMSDKVSRPPHLLIDAEGDEHEHVADQQFSVLDLQRIAAQHARQCGWHAVMLAHSMFDCTCAAVIWRAPRCLSL